VYVNSYVIWLKLLDLKLQACTLSFQSNTALTLCQFWYKMSCYFRSFVKRLSSLLMGKNDSYKWPLVHGKIDFFSVLPVVRSLNFICTIISAIAIYLGKMLSIIDTVAFNFLFTVFCQLFIFLAERI